jgi:hypothetical protein
MVECLPSKNKALSSVLNTDKKFVHIWFLVNIAYWLAVYPP